MPVWEHTIKMKHKEIEWKGVEWVCLFQDSDKWWAVLNIVMKYVIEPKRCVFFLVLFWTITSTYFE